jgi:hypothetical protein
MSGFELHPDGRQGTGMPLAERTGAGVRCLRRHRLEANGPTQAAPSIRRFHHGVCSPVAHRQRPTIRSLAHLSKLAPVITLSHAASIAALRYPRAHRRGLEATPQPAPGPSATGGPEDHATQAAASSADIRNRSPPIGHITLGRRQPGASGRVTCPPSYSAPSSIRLRSTNVRVAPGAS